MSEIKRKRNESFEAFMRRVKRQWQSSGKILQARKIQFFSPGKSKNVQRTETLSRKKKMDSIEYLRKIGKLPEDPRQQRRKR